MATAGVLGSKGREEMSATSSVIDFLRSCPVPPQLAAGKSSAE